MKKIKEKPPTKEEILASAIKELQFANLQIQYLLSVLNELEIIGDILTKEVIKNAKERHLLDKLIHNKKLFSGVLRRV